MLTCAKTRFGQWDAAILPRLPQRLLPQFRHWFELMRREKLLVKEALLAVGQRDSLAFRAALDRLNPVRTLTSLRFRLFGILRS
eukprot:COSAG04_NODE_3543_length_2722_cov_75.937095_5_plen_84_part_00